MTEIWQRINQSCEISNRGRTKRNGKIYVYKANNSGYLTVRNPGKVGLHEVVMRDFGPDNPDPSFYTCIDHIDRNPRNNAVWNLRWSNNCLNHLNTNARNYHKVSHANSFQVFVGFLGHKWTKNFPDETDAKIIGKLARQTAFDFISEHKVRITDEKKIADLKKKLFDLVDSYKILKSIVEKITTLIINAKPKEERA